MTDLMETGAIWWSNQLKESASRTVTYQRSPSVTVQLTATIGKTTFRLEDEQGFLTVFQSRDYSFETAELILAGAETRPQRGDRIIEASGHVYELMQLTSGGTDEDIWKYADPYRIRIVVHTKQVVDTGPS